MHSEIILKNSKKDINNFNNINLKGVYDLALGYFIRKIMINSKQRAFLRAMANSLDNTMQIGKSGITDHVKTQIEELLDMKEIVKANVLKTCESSPKEVAHEIANSIDADVVSVVGRKFVMYRKSEKLAKEGKSIILPW